MTVAFEPSIAIAYLVPIAGPPMARVEITGNPRGQVIGRLEQCEVRLAADSVSRHHARISFDGLRWRIADLKSSWGTFVNGVQVAPSRDAALGDGDVVRISPWTFRFSTNLTPKAGVLEGGMELADDSEQASGAINTVPADRLPTLDAEMFALLLDCAAGIHAAQDEKALAAVVLDKACQGSGLYNAALLKPAGSEAKFQVIASRSAEGAAPIGYSRSLLNAASRGELAELSADKQNFDITQSIVSMGVRSALCVPLMMDQTVAAYLYLDSRGDPNSAHRLPLRPHAASFCLALGRIAGLALANLKRMEMQRRSAAIEADLAAASAAQQWILPPTTATAGPFTHTGRSRAGEYVGGDFYDVIPLGDDRLAVAIGDVSGHGVAASVLMTASAGFLNAVLQETGDAAAAANRLNRFICPRRAADKFMTLWIGVLDLPGRMLYYVDAGHRYAFVTDEAGQFHQLETGAHFPVGIDETYEYTTAAAPLFASGRLLLISDGLVEQLGNSDDATEAAQFGLDGVARVTNAAGEADVVAALFDAVVKHAGRATLSDDATAVLVKW